MNIRQLNKLVANAHLYVYLQPTNSEGKIRRQLTQVWRCPRGCLLITVSNPDKPTDVEQFTQLNPGDKKVVSIEHDPHANGKTFSTRVSPFTLDGLDLATIR